MEEISNLLIKKFDIKKFDSACNAIGCNEEISKVILFKEKHLTKLSEKEIAKIYLCEDHSNSLRKLIRELNSISIKNKKIISIDIQDFN